MDSELLKTNALYSDLKFRKLLEKCCDFNRRTDGDKLYYYDGDNPVMRGTYFPLFEVDSEMNFRSLSGNLPAPANEEELNALIALLYQDFYYMDTIPTEHGHVYIGLKDVEMLNEAVFKLDENAN